MTISALTHDDRIAAAKAIADRIRARNAALTNTDERIHMNTTPCSKNLHEYARHCSSLPAFAGSADSDSMGNEGFPTPLERDGADAPEVPRVAFTIGQHQVQPRASLGPALNQGLPEQRLDDG